MLPILANEKIDLIMQQASSSPSPLIPHQPTPPPTPPITELMTRLVPDASILKTKSPSPPAPVHTKETSQSVEKRSSQERPKSRKSN